MIDKNANKKNVSKKALKKQALRKTIKLSEELHAELKKEADSKSWTILKLIKTMLDRQKRNPM